MAVSTAASSVVDLVDMKAVSLALSTGKTTAAMMGAYSAERWADEKEGYLVAEMVELTDASGVADSVGRMGVSLAVGWADQMDKSWVV